MVMEQPPIGSYQVLERIATGGQATVYRARHNRTGQVVALKVMRTLPPALREQFQRGARLAASINHPNVVRIHEVAQDGSNFFIAMEYLPRTLESVIREEGPLPEQQAVDIARQVLLALDAASQRRIVHGDLKPQNILIDGDGVVKVGDFGIASVIDPLTIPGTGMVMGTPHYMSPQQADMRRVDARCDLYSLGVILYRMLTGKHLFDAESPQAILDQHRYARPPLVRESRPEVSPMLDALVDRCLAKVPAQRVQSAQAMLQALAALAREPGAQLL